MIRSAAAVIGAVGVCAGSASAAVSLATSGSTLFRTDLNTGVTQTFDLGDDIVSQNVMSDGRILAYSNTEGPNGYEVYELTGALGDAPTLSLIGERNSRAWTHTEVDGSVYAIENGRFFVMNSESYQLNEIADLGVTMGGSAYDAATDTFYAISGNTDSLYRVNGYNTLDPTLELIGNVGVEVTNQGLEFVDGVLYAAIQNEAADTLSVGTIDTLTGAFSGLVDLEIDGSGPTSIAVVAVPSPGAAMLAGVAGVAAFGRRRR